MFEKLMGDKKFYKMVLTIAVPIMIQNGVTNFVSLLDNIMVGQTGTAQMAGVAIINQLFFVFNLCIFGGLSGAGIFTAQYYGRNDHEGVRNTFRFKLIICGVITALGLMLFLGQGTQLISLYLQDSTSAANNAETLGYALRYLHIQLIGLIPFVVSQAYSSTLREVGETVLPMKASIWAVAVNMCLNYALIFGKFGMPCLGVIGAAIATVIARFVECLIIVVWTHYHHRTYVFIENAYRHFKVPHTLVKQILIKGTPLLLNETLWAGSMAVLNQCYSLKGLSVVASLSISSTITNLFNIVFMALGSAVSIIVGPLLGAGKMKEAKQTAYRMITFSVIVCFLVGCALLLVAPFFPMIYRTTDEVKLLATQFIRISALCMPMFAFLHATYFTIRSGGKTVITFLFDSVFSWCISIPIIYSLVHFTGIPILPLFLVGQLMDGIKCIIGFYLLKKGVWIQSVIKEVS